MKNQNTDDIRLKPGETITDETLDRADRRERRRQRATALWRSDTQAQAAPTRASAPRRLRRPVHEVALYGRQNGSVETCVRPVRQLCAAGCPATTDMRHATAPDRPVQSDEIRRPLVVHLRPTCTTTSRAAHHAKDRQATAARLTGPSPRRHTRALPEHATDICKRTRHQAPRLRRCDGSKVYTIDGQHLRRKWPGRSYYLSNSYIVGIWHARPTTAAAPGTPTQTARRRATASPAK